MSPTIEIGGAMTRWMFLVLLLGCGDDAAVDDAGARDAGSDSSFDARPIDGGNDADGVDASVDADCGGCDQAGVCEPGTSRTACGRGGVSCVTCADGESCVDGACETPDECQMSCAGCCSDSGCLPGDSSSACGTGGLMCGLCDVNETCLDGTCVASCADTCLGCCTAEGVCQPGTDAAACGTGGASCVDCGSDSCSASVCVASSCADTCDGCCSGDTCLAGDSTAACGGGGAACVDCGASFTCSASGCAVEPSSRWDVVVVRATTPTTNWEGSPWDSGGGLPDVKVRLTAMDGAVDFRGTSSTASNDETPEIDEIVLDGIPARALTSAPGLIIEIIDGDPFGDDAMTSCSWVPDNAAFGTGTLLTCPSRAVDDPLGPAVEASVVLELLRD